MILIREAMPLDSKNIHNIHMHAFNNDEAKNVAALALNLLNEHTSPKTYTFVAELDGSVAGHIAFSPVTFNPNNKLKSYILAPLGVKPEFQNQKVGSILIKYGIEQLSKDGVYILFVYGDPKYYGKFGFNEKTSANFLPPYKLQYPFGWLALALNAECFDNRTVKVSCVASLCDPSLW